MPDAILEVEQLVKEYGTFRAVDGISFAVPKGKIIGFLGPNGAGKTTTIQILLGITLPTSGTIKYFGKDFYRHREACLQRINFTSAFNTLQGKITVYENLLVFAYFYNVKDKEKKIRELIHQFEADDILHKRYWDLSAGQKTRVNLVKSLLNDPELILMDEPSASLDPDIADKTLTFIEQLRKERNITILYTSHDMEEVSRVCDEVIFLDRGKIVAHDTPLNLTKRIQRAQLILTIEKDKHLLEEYLKQEHCTFSFADEHMVSIETTEDSIPKLIFGISKSGVRIVNIEVKRPTLEDVFLHIARNKTYGTD